MRIAVNSLQPGMVLAHNIYSDEGVLLLGADLILSDVYIARLSSMGIGVVDIRSSYLESTDMPEIIAPEIRRQTISAVRDAFAAFQATKKITTGVIFASVENIVHDILKNPNALIHIHEIRSYDNYTFAHSVNVGIIAALVGLKLGYDEWRLKQLTLGGVLHDIGKMLVPKKILNKPAQLNSMEMQKMMQHSDLGFDILRKQKFTIPLTVSHVAFQHHEKYDGTGYPRGLCSDEIHEYARIVSIADVYDALTSERPYRRGLLPHQAYEVMQSLSGQHFDPEILAVFIKRIAPYPQGTIVQINTGYVGIVTEIDQGIATRPVIKLLLDNYGKKCKEERCLDLSKELTTFVIKVYDEAEMLALDSILARENNKTS